MNHVTATDDLDPLLESAWDLSRERHGNTLSVHVPGMFVVNGRRGRYHAISITGDECELDCDHCKGSLLRTMAHVRDAEDLVSAGLDAAARGDRGILVTGGCDRNGRLPWDRFTHAIRDLKRRTDLVITVHAGQVDLDTATALRDAGVDQALVDVIGDDATAREVYHLPDGAAAVRRTLDALAATGLEIVPHILVGLYYGRERGERAALGLLGQYPVTRYVVVVIMPAKGTPMAGVEPPAPERVARLLVEARLAYPDLSASLGCARPRGRYRRRLDVLAVRAGINVLAVPSEEALSEAAARGLTITHHETCCSLSGVDRGGRSI
jgi:lipoyl synthase